MKKVFLLLSCFWSGISAQTFLEKCKNVFLRSPEQKERSWADNAQAIEVLKQAEQLCSDIVKEYEKEIKWHAHMLYAYDATTVKAAEQKLYDHLEHLYALKGRAFDYLDDVRKIRQKLQRYRAYLENIEKAARHCLATKEYEKDAHMLGVSANLLKKEHRYTCVRAPQLKKKIDQLESVFDPLEKCVTRIDDLPIGYDVQYPEELKQMERIKQKALHPLTWSRQFEYSRKQLQARGGGKVEVEAHIPLFRIKLEPDPERRFTDEYILQTRHKKEIDKAKEILQESEEFNKLAKPENIFSSLIKFVFRLDGHDDNQDKQVNHALNLSEYGGMVDLKSTDEQTLVDGYRKMRKKYLVDLHPDKDRERTQVINALSFVYREDPRLIEKLDEETIKNMKKEAFDTLSQNPDKFKKEFETAHKIMSQLSPEAKQRYAEWEKTGKLKILSDFKKSRIDEIEKVEKEYERRSKQHKQELEQIRSECRLIDRSEVDEYIENCEIRTAREKALFNDLKKREQNRVQRKQEVISQGPVLPLCQESSEMPAEVRAEDNTAGDNNDNDEQEQESAEESGSESSQSSSDEARGRRIQSNESYLFDNLKKREQDRLEKQQGMLRGLARPLYSQALTEALAKARSENTASDRQNDEKKDQNSKQSSNNHGKDGENNSEEKKKEALNMSPPLINQPVQTSTRAEPGEPKDNGIGIGPIPIPYEDIHVSFLRNFQK